MELNVEGLQMQKCLPTAKDNRVDEKNEVNCLVIIFTKIIVTNMSKVAHFFVFFRYGCKNIFIIWAEHLSAPERFYLAH